MSGAMEGHEKLEDDLIQDIMASMGWSNSFVPIASDENKKLLANIKFLGKTKLERVDALDNQGIESLRVRALFNTADNEFDQNLKLLTAHKSQYSTEYHLFKLSEHDDSKYKQMLKETEKNQKEMTRDQESLKSKLFESYSTFTIIFLSFKQTKKIESMDRLRSLLKAFNGQRVHSLNGDK